MAPLSVSQSNRVDAPANQVYDLLADYREGHPRIVPPQYFTGIEVEQGGKGAGTVIRVGMRVLGVSRTLRMKVSEPKPGRVLAESDLESDMVTRFTLNPLPDGKSTRVTITTEWTPKPGLAGLLDRWVTPAVMRRIYAEELKLINSQCNQPA